jgi:hypothetical protein
MYNIIHNRSVFTNRYTVRSSGNFHLISKVFLVHAMMSTRKGVRVRTQLYSFGTLSGFGGVEVACWTLVPKFAGSHPAEAVLYPREGPGTHCTGGWVGPRAGLDRC